MGVQVNPLFMMVSDSGFQLVSFFSQRVYTILKVANAITTTYHPQINGQAEPFNRTLTEMLCYYVKDYPTDWCQYARAI